MMNPQNTLELFCYRIKLLFIVFLGELIKSLIDLKVIKPKRQAVTGIKTNPRLIVSLTSYGRRVNLVYYTIISLLRQTVQPDMVILWLDSDNWNVGNLPKSLLQLQKYGLSVKFCKDLKSYKKLIPALEQFPDAMIVTCDDDIYYRKNMVERLVLAYKNDPTKVYAHRAHWISFNGDGSLQSYNNWLEEISADEGFRVFPTSGGGTLYTRNLLYKDMCNSELFMKLSPNADDVWNYFMGFLQNTRNVVLPYKGYIYVPLDVFYQIFHKGSNLSGSNEGQSMNDAQIKSIMDYYKITDFDLNK